MIESGLEEYAESRYEEALALFERAHTVQPSSRTFRAMGMASFELRRYASAAVYLHAALRDEARPLPHKMRDDVSALLQRASQFVVRAHVVLSPASASLSVDGRAPVRSEDGLVLLDPGQHEFAAANPGYENLVRRVDWSSGSEPSLELSLQRLAPEERAEPVATEQVAVTNPESPHKRGAAPIILGAGAAVAAIAAGVSVAMRERYARDVRDSCGGASPRSIAVCDDWLDHGRAWRVGAIASGGVGVTLAVAAIITRALDRPRESPALRALRSCTVAVGRGAEFNCQVSAF